MSGFRVATQRVNTPPLHRGPEVVSMVHLRVIPCPKLHFEALGGGLEDRVIYTYIGVVSRSIHARKVC